MNRSKVQNWCNHQEDFREVAAPLLLTYRQWGLISHLQVAEKRTPFGGDRLHKTRYKEGVSRRPEGQMQVVKGQPPHSVHQVSRIRHRSTSGSFTFDNAIPVDENERIRPIRAWLSQFLNVVKVIVSFVSDQLNIKFRYVLHAYKTEAFTRK